MRMKQQVIDGITLYRRLASAACPKGAWFGGNYHTHFKNNGWMVYETGKQAIAIYPTAKMAKRFIVNQLAKGAIKDKKGNVIGRESWLSADDRQDYVVSEKETPTQDKAQGKIVQPEPSQQAAAQKPVNSVMPGEDYAAQVKKLDDDTNRLLSDGGFQISGKQPKSKTGEADLLKKGYKPYLVNGKGELEVNVLGVWAKPTAGEKEIADGKRQKAIDKYIEHMIPHSRNQ